MTTKETAIKTFDCEEVLLPDSNTTNGMDAGNDGIEVEYLEEHDPMCGDADDGQKNENENENENENSAEEQEQEEEEDDEDEENEQGTEHEEVDGEEEEISPIVGHKSNILPKKRRTSNSLISPLPTAATPEATTPTTTTTTAAAAATSTENETIEASPKDLPDNDEDESASTSRAAAAKADNQVDEEQCRVCTSKENLESLFKEMDNRQTIADMLMTICPSVSIALKDFMPQFICSPCLNNVTIALQLKTQCETTERELRKKLSRSKNKVRRPVGYVTIDATIDSDPPSDEEPNDDVEFKVSDDASISADDDSEDSDFSGKRRASRGGGGAKRGRRRPMAGATTSRGKKQKFIKRHFNDDGSDNDTFDEKSKKRKKSINIESPGMEFSCDECDQVFQRKLSLVLHKKSHSTERLLINCEICGKQFKMQGAYRTHLQRHKEDSPGHPCEKCDEVYASKADLKRHLAEDHNEPGMVYTCKKCQRTFVSSSRLEKHTLRCPGHPAKPKRLELEGHVVGQDLFKTVAPLTTTYWSDSFSD